jgi:hypothetical protein
MAGALIRQFIKPARDVQASESTMSLDKGATIWVDQPIGRRVSCESGSLWLCYDGEPLDVLLGPGETYLCTKRSALTIHALSPSVGRVG